MKLFTIGCHIGGQDGLDSFIIQQILTCHAGHFDVDKIKIFSHIFLPNSFNFILFALLIKKENSLASRRYPRAITLMGKYIIHKLFLYPAKFSVNKTLFAQIFSILKLK